MKRIISAFHNSVAAFQHLAGHEKAFQQELAVLVLGVPIAFLISPDPLIRFILIAAIVFVMIVEVLNTGIEAACNALSREFNADIKIAKDCGSLAVLAAIGLGGSVWLLALWAYLIER
ncbi:MAG: diacylglycerol kinase [Rhizobiaceae bacterium]